MATYIGSCYTCGFCAYRFRTAVATGPLGLLGDVYIQLFDASDKAKINASSTKSEHQSHVSDDHYYYTSLLYQLPRDNTSLRELP